MPLIDASLNVIRISLNRSLTLFQILDNSSLTSCIKQLKSNWYLCLFNNLGNASFNSNQTSDKTSPIACRVPIFNPDKIDCLAVFCKNLLL